MISRLERTWRQTCVRRRIIGKLKDDLLQRWHIVLFFEDIQQLLWKAASENETALTRRCNFWALSISRNGTRPIIGLLTWTEGFDHCVISAYWSCPLHKTKQKSWGNDCILDGRRHTDEGNEMGNFGIFKPLCDDGGLRWNDWGRGQTWNGAKRADFGRNSSYRRILHPVDPIN